MFLQRWFEILACVYRAVSITIHHGYIVGPYQVLKYAVQVL